MLVCIPNTTCEFNQRLNGKRDLDIALCQISSLFVEYSLTNNKLDDKNVIKPNAEWNNKFPQQLNIVF